MESKQNKTIFFYMENLICPMKTLPLVGPELQFLGPWQWKKKQQNKSKKQKLLLLFPYTFCLDFLGSFQRDFVI